jgi:hypothetical protein
MFSVKILQIHVLDLFLHDCNCALSVRFLCTGSVEVEMSGVIMIDKRVTAVAKWIVCDYPEN